MTNDNGFPQIPTPSPTTDFSGVQIQGGTLRDIFDKKTAEDFLETNLNIGKSFVNQVPIRKTYVPPEMGAFYSPGAKPFIALPSDRDVWPEAFIHESAHHFQRSLNDEDATTLQNLIEANPPGEASTPGFNTPKGAPDAHHPVSSEWALADYFDYSPNAGGFATPYSQLFRSDVEKPWKNIPDPILDFIRTKHPPSIKPPEWSDSSMNPWTMKGPWDGS